MRFNALAGQAMASPDQSQQLLGQAAQINPMGAAQIQNVMDRRQAVQDQAQQATQAEHDKRLNRAAQYMLTAIRKGDPAAINNAYQATRPIVESLTGNQMPAQFDPSMTPHIERIALQTGGISQPDPLKVGPGTTLLNPETMKPEYSAPEQTRITYQHVPDGKGGYVLQSFDQNGKPVSTLGHMPASTGPEGVDQSLLSDDGRTLVATAIAHGVKLPIPSLGRGRQGGAMRAVIINRLAEQAKNSGMNPDQYVANIASGSGSQKALSDTQKTAAKIGAWEHSASRQADIALGLSQQVSRSGSPILNDWILSGRQATGDPTVAAFNNSVDTLAEEYARVMGGGNSSATDSSRALAHKMLNSAMSQQQFQRVVTLMKQEMSTRAQALQESTMHQQSMIYDAPGSPSQFRWQGQKQEIPSTAPQHGTAPIDQIMSKYGSQ